MSDVASTITQRNPVAVAQKERLAMVIYQGIPGQRGPQGEAGFGASIYFTPLSHDPVFDGVTDNAAQLEAAIAEAVSYPNQAQDGNAPVVDGGGVLYCISRPIVVAGVRGLTLQNARVLMIGSGWDSTMFAFVAASTAVDTRFFNIKVEGNRKGAGGFSLIGFGSQAERCHVIRYKGRGFSLTGAGGDCKVINCSATEWANGDAEFTNNANYTATGIYVDKNDCSIMGTVSRWSKRNLHLGPNCKTLMVGAGTHFYNGASGAAQRQYPVNIYAEAGSNANFENFYMDNGSAELYSPNISFGQNCIAVHTPANALLAHWIALYANGQTSPYQFRTGVWQTGSTSLLQKPADGGIPFILPKPKLDTDGVTVLESWAGDYDAFVAAGGYKAASETIVSSRTQNDAGLNIIYDAPGNGGEVGAGVGVRSASTPAAFRDNPPSLREKDGGAYLFRPKTPPQIVTGDASISLDQLGNEITVNNAAYATIRLPAAAIPGSFLRFVLGEGSEAAVRLRTPAETPTAKLIRRGSVGEIELYGIGSREYVSCISNADGNSAVWVSYGDSEQDNVRILGNGFIFLTQEDARREILFENTALATANLPANARIGFKAWFSRADTSTFEARIRANPAFSSSEILGVSAVGHKLLNALDSAEVVCIRNVDGVSAKFLVRPTT